MTRATRTVSHDGGSLDLAYQPKADAARFHFERVVLSLDASTFKNYWDPFPAFNQLILGTGADQEGDSGHTYIIQLSNRDLALPTPFVIIDGSDLRGSDFSGADPFFGDAAIISTTGVTVADAHITTGGGNDSVSSGIGSDTIRTGDGDDFVSIGSGTDTIYLGAGNDYIESTYGDFSAADRIYAGGGIDEISFYAQDIADADFANTRSVEWIGLTSGGDLELGKEAQRVGIEKLFVDTTEHAITVTKDFTRTLDIGNSNFYGLVSLDASQSSATILWHAEYNYSTTAPTLIGGTGSEDTIFITSGFSGLPPYGGDLTNMSGFEHVQVLTSTGDAPAHLILDTKVGEINAAFLDVDAHTLSSADPLLMNAREATADIHVVAGVGDDRVILGDGDDRIEGGGGADLLAGRGGNDTFLYSAVTDSSGESIDTVKGFRSGHDVIDVTGLGDAAVHGQEIAFFGNQESGSGADRAFADTAGDGVLDAVFRSDTHTLWFDTNDDGQLTDADLHLVLAGATALTGADVLAVLVVLCGGGRRAGHPPGSSPVIPSRRQRTAPTRALAARLIAQRLGEMIAEQLTDRGFRRSKKWRPSTTKTRPCRTSAELPHSGRLVSGAISASVGLRRSRPRGIDLADRPARADVPARRSGASSALSRAWSRSDGQIAHE